MINKTYIGQQQTQVTLGAVKSRSVPSMSFLKDTLIEAVENRRNHQVAGVAKLANVQVWVAVLVELDMVVSPGAGNVERWNRLKEGGMGCCFM